MTASRYGRPFYPITSSAPSFKVDATATSAAVVLESSSVNRTWQGPTNRAIRIACPTDATYTVAFGSSTIVADSTAHMLLLGGTVESFYISPDVTYIAFVSSTDVTFSVTLGYGA